MELNPKANDGRGAFEFNEHYPLIARIWELARTMGGARIAEVLLEEGYTSPYPRKGKKKALSDEVVRNILRRRSAVGEFQPSTRGNKPNGAPSPEYSSKSSPRPSGGRFAGLLRNGTPA